MANAINSLHTDFLEELEIPVEEKQSGAMALGRVASLWFWKKMILGYEVNTPTHLRCDCFTLHGQEPRYNK